MFLPLAHPAIIPIDGSDRPLRRTPARSGPAFTEPRRRTPLRAPNADDHFEPNPRSEQLARIFNIMAALFLLALFAPVMLVTALLIKLTSRGPIIYTQMRVGLDRRWTPARALNERRRENVGGKLFRIYKFRSMRVDAESAGVAVWALPEDERVTAIGRVIRRTRIDELPQLINVLRGEMNIVGPRPERPSIFVRLRDQVGGYPLRQRVKPGITGLAQISNPYDRTLDDVERKVHFDLEYMRRQGIGEDLRIMALTVPVMLFRMGGW